MYEYQITSTSVKLTAIKKHFYSLSENVYMSMYVVQEKKLTTYEGLY